MKKEISKLLKLPVTAIATFAIFFASVAANTTCAFIVHQSELPKEVNVLRKHR